MFPMGRVEVRHHCGSRTEFRGTMTVDKKILHLFFTKL